jgi:phosphonate transport system substrate-binding protein
MKRAILSLLLAVPLGTSSVLAQSKPTFVFTAIPDQDETRLIQRFTKVADLLQKKLGVDVKYLPVKSYPATVTAFVNSQVQLAWFGGFTGVQARSRVAGSEAIAQGAEDVSFKSFLIANTKTGLESSKELPRGIAGKTFTFGSRSSTSGRLMPEYFIRKEFGKGPDEIFTRVGFSGDHSRTIQLVQSGAFETGVLDYTVWGLEDKAGKIDHSKVKVIWESPTYPDYQWTVRGDVDMTYGVGFKEKLKAALLSIDDPEIMKQFARSKFIPAKNSDYAPIAEVGKVTKLLN